MIQGEESECGEYQTLVDELHAAIHQYYNSPMLSGKCHWGPEGAPMRGDYSEAIIHLKKGAEARAQKQIELAGERHATTKANDEGEQPTGEQNLAVGIGDTNFFPSRRSMVHGEE